jgi:hypothetical protein
VTAPSALAASPMARPRVRIEEWPRLAALIVPLVVVEAVVSAVGAFVPEVYEGLVPPHYVAESRGQDLVSLVVAVPLLLLGLWRLRSGRPEAVMKTSGALLYVAYVSVLYAYGGVANPLYFGYVAALGLSVFGAWQVGSSVRIAPADAPGRLPTRTTAVFLWVVAVLLLLIWGGMGVAAIEAGAPSEANTILVTDLAFVIPLFVLAGTWLWRRRPRGAVLGGSLLVFNVVLNASIVVGQAMRPVHGFEPSWGLGGFFAAIGLVSAALAVPFLRRAERGSSSVG